jgi:hypothetical protein
MNLLEEDRWDRDVIIHEYGHYIHRSYDFADGSAGNSTVHGWYTDLRNYPEEGIRSETQAMNLAFREAWATLFSVAVQNNDNWYPYSGGAIYNDTLDQTIEDNLEIRPNLNDLAAHNNLASSAYLEGECIECLNCCTLWDIFDNNNSSADNNDAVSDLSLDKIWTISRYDKPNTIEDFWYSWVQRYSNTSSISRIFKDHKMTFVP